jgi:ketosteroid isomerase-like protein
VTDNRGVDAGSVVAEFWRRIQARDWDGMRSLLADDVTIEWPNSLLRISGADNVVEFNRTYPEGWSIDVRRVVAEGDVAVSEVRVPHETFGPSYVVALYEVDEGRITRGREYWTEERYEPPPAERAQWFEPMENT